MRLSHEQIFEKTQSPEGFLIISQKPQKMRAILIVHLAALLLFTGSAEAQAPTHIDKIVSVRQSVSGNTLRLVLETSSRPPVGSVFYYTGPERLFVELNDALPATKLGAPPNAQMVKAWTLKQTAMNRSQLILELDHRPATSELNVAILSNPHRLVVDVPLNAGVSDDFPLTEGVRWVREDRFLDGRWVRLNRLLFDPKDPNVEVKIGLAKENLNARETVTSMVSRHGSLAGINGGYFAGGGGVLGLVYRDGKIVAPHVSRRPPRSSFGLTKQGQALFGRLAAQSGRIVDLEGGDWSQAELALGGGPRLLQNGSARITAKEEELGPGGNDITRVAARTLVGQQQNGEILFATVSGFRDNHSQGVKFEPLVSWLKGLGVRDAVNFDGGASVDMVIGEHIVSDGPGNASQEKPVATALLINDGRERLYPSKAVWQIERRTLPGDGSSTSNVSVSLTTPSGQPVPNGTLVRFFAHNLAVEPAEAKTENGRVEVKVKAMRRRGPARLTMTCGPITQREVFELQGGAVTRIWAQVTSRSEPTEKEKKGWSRTQFKLQLVDQWGTSVANQTYRISLDGAAFQEFQTDALGMSHFTVDAPPEGTTVTISSGGAPNLIIPVPAVAVP